MPLHLRRCIVLHIHIVYFLFSSGSYLGAFVPAKIDNKECPQGCTNYGNCNAETGECECRFGFGGKDCSERLMPACHSTPDISTSIPGFGHWFPKNCYCHKQLGKVGCPRPFYREPHDCDYYQFWHWKDTYCYVLKDVPEDKQYSIPPDGPFDPRYQWKRGEHNMSKALLDMDPYDLVDSGPPTPYELPNGDKLLPIDKCPERCSGHGWCVSKPGRPSEDPTCECHDFYHGAACETPRNEHCYLGCSDRGTCSGGFCHCQPGYWGLGCSRSKAYTAKTWLPHPTKLKIYVYDLPENMSYRKPWHDAPPLLDTMYLAEVSFMEQLLGDWAVRTENPWEANLFVINSYAIYYTGNIGFPGKHFHTLFTYIRNTYPFWNMTNGRNHVAIATNDRGCCDLYRLAKEWPEVQHPIKLVHFGQAGARSRSGPHGHPDPAYEAALREFRRLGSHRDRDRDRERGLEEGGADGQGPGGQDWALQENMEEARLRFRGLPGFNLEAIRMEREPCFRPEQDVAIPNYLDTGWIRHVEDAYEVVDGKPRFKPRNRPYLFYFHGFTKDDMAYSGGVRQGIFAMFGNLSRPDVSINEGAGGDWMASSRFCLCPLGYGWGIRLTQAMQTGCVPIIVQDHIYTAFWDVLPYEKFSVRINRHNLHRLFDILEAITPEQLADLQQGLADYHRYFIWHPQAGGLAYNATITSLHRRLLNLWTALFRGSI